MITNILPHTVEAARLPGGVAFNNESIFIFTLGSGDNIQITAIQEFIDTKLAAEFAAAASAAVAPK